MFVLSSAYEIYSNRCRKRDRCIELKVTEAIR